VSRYQKGKTSLDFTEARDNEWQWNLLDHMQVCTSLQTDKHASTPPLSFFTGWMPFLSPNQQRQSTESKSTEGKVATLPCNLSLIACFLTVMFHQTVWQYMRDVVGLLVTAILQFCIGIFQ